MLPEEVTSFIGKAEERVVITEVEKGAIRKFADAVGETNPLYYNEDYARDSRYGSLVAPPGFFGWSPKQEDWQQPTATTGVGSPTGVRAELGAAIVKAGFAGIFDGGIEYEFLKPIRAGDTLAASIRIKDVYEREGRMGTMVFRVTETTYTNQHGDVVAISRGTGISYPLSKR